MASRERVGDLAGNAALIVPLLLVNSVALYGQAQWGYEHLARNWVVAVGFALAIESIGVYLAAEAHRALLAGDAALRLRLGSYLIGVLAGALNYAHFAPALDAPNTQAIVFGVLSAISPVLWAIRSRSISRDDLRAKHLIDGRAVKFTAAQWMLFPRRSAAAFRAAVWAGVVEPAQARALVDPQPAQETVSVTVLPRKTAAAPGPRRKEITALAGRQRLRPDQHPLWPDWLAAWQSGSPWSDEVMAEKLGEGTTFPAARSRRQRWERFAAELSASG